VCEDQLLPNEFNYIQWEASSGGLSCPESDDRHAYYSDNGTGIPDTRFDGSWMDLVGAPESYATGEYFMQLVDQRRATTSPVAVVVSDFSFEEPGAFVEVKVLGFGSINPANHFVRVAIVEDDLTYGGSPYQNVARDMLPNSTGTALTVTGPGDEQVLNLDLAMQAGWNPDKLQIIAWVQNDATKEIIQSGNSFVGEFAAVAGVDGPQQVIADGAQVVFDTANVINIGLNADTFDISLDTSDLPEGWAAHLAYDGSEYDQFSVALGAFESVQFNVVMDTGDVGSGRVVVDVYSQGAGEVVASLDFAALAGGTELLVVADDDGQGHSYTAYGPAIAASNKTYAIWDLGLAPLAGGETLLDYEAVIWQTGSNGVVMDADDRAILDQYLAAGGNLILAGEDLLESLYNQGGSARLWYQLKLRLNYGDNDSGNLQVDGVDGDVIGDGLAFELTGGDPDVIALLNNQPVEPSFRYGTDAVAGARTTYGDYLVVTLPFGLERVPMQADRDAIIHGALDWFGLLEVTPVEDELPGAGLALRQNTPNPFNPLTKIAFRLDQAGPAQLAIYDTRGQLVRTLVSESLPAGSHEVIWDGKTDAGRQAASGTYFYRLDAGQQQLTRKMTLVK